MHQDINQLPNDGREDRPRDTYTRLPDVVPCRCPVCGAEAALHRYSEGRDEPSQYVVMCEREGQLGPLDGNMVDSCLLNMPPRAFYCATRRRALASWHEYAVALVDARRATTQEPRP